MTFDSNSSTHLVGILSEGALAVLKCPQVGSPRKVEHSTTYLLQHSRGVFLIVVDRNFSLAYLCSNIEGTRRC